MRIIRGSCKGRKLVPFSGKNIRPTTDRVREAVFNIIEPGIKKAHVLDLFAGTGANGIEALSRGAENAVFIDISDKSCALIKKNIQVCKIKKNTLIFCHNINKSIIPEYIKNRKFDLVFIDPPYGTGFLKKILKDLCFIKILKHNALIIAEHSIKEDISGKMPGFDIYDQRKYGKTLISFLTKTISMKVL
ncbi:MAG: 16S rRNA (guanine(966)-N(2))-methyltransferase RsmD [Desulfobacteraceae bacterium 4572_130]|nr:MAG: 16S rRNA (guanine(966)-N(2))-methyltransferase RsmD [Desulfobacteraceae bacterium 4572_130]